jgi:hypothetical protein
MLIRGKRIRNLRRHMRGVPASAPVVVALTDPDRFGEQLTQIGFTDRLDPCETVLPSPVGPTTLSGKGRHPDDTGRTLSG